MRKTQERRQCSIAIALVIANQWNWIFAQSPFVQFLLSKGRPKRTFQGTRETLKLEEHKSAKTIEKEKVRKSKGGSAKCKAKIPIFWKSFFHGVFFQ
jgi:hypothetical protein